MYTPRRRSLIAAALMAACAASAAAVDLQPPEVPNPYGTSEGRAIRDHLEETYKIKASDKLAVEELRALYRKTWNTDQEQRYLDEKTSRPADPAWVKAYTAERDQEQRAKWVGMLGKLGVTAPADATVDQLRDLAAKTKREQEEAADTKRKAEAAKIREEIAKQNADAAAAAPAPSTASVKGAVALTPVFGEKDILSDDAIRTAVRLITTMPNKTEVERQKIDNYADSLINKRKAFIAKENAKPILTSGTGLEIWRGTTSYGTDTEKENTSLFFLNVSADYMHLKSVEYTFAASTRNMDGTAEFHTGIPAISSTMWFICTSYKDPGQIFSISNVVITREP